MLGLFYLFFISQPDDQCALSGSNKHIASLTCLSIVNLWRILSSGAILVSYSPKRLSINLLHLFFCLYSFSRVSFLYKLKKELLINYKLPKPYQFKKQKIIINHTNQKQQMMKILLFLALLLVFRPVHGSLCSYNPLSDSCRKSLSQHDCVSTRLHSTDSVKCTASCEQTLPEQKSLWLQFSGSLEILA